MVYTEQDIWGHIEQADNLYRCEAVVRMIEAPDYGFLPQNVREGMRRTLDAKIQAILEGLSREDIIVTRLSDGKEERIKNTVETFSDLVNGDEQYFCVKTVRGDAGKRYLHYRWMLREAFTIRPADMPLTDGAGI